MSIFHMFVIPCSIPYCILHIMDLHIQPHTEILNHLCTILALGIYVV